MCSSYADSYHVYCGMLGLKFKLGPFDCASV